MPGRTRLLYLYASDDESLQQALDSHLTSLANEGIIEGRHVGQLLAGTHISEQLAAEVAQAGAVLLLLSADFMASASCASLLVQVHEQCAARRLLVVPVLARPVDWRALGLAGLQPLPRNGVPVTLWQNQDAAWVDVANDLRALLTGDSLTRASKEIIDFASERLRHESFWGREDVLAQLDQWLHGGRSRGYVLVTGAPGMGKSAILNEWLRRYEQTGEPVSHHFLRRGQWDWDQPAAVTRNLAAQIEQIFPAQCDPQAQPERRLGDLLLRVSRDVLVPAKRRLILVIDGLDEAAAPAGDNPLQLFLPWALPPGVLVLCASRPTYPNLGWLKARDGGVPTVDLDDLQWSRSNEEACRRFWLAQEFTPPLPSSLIAQALDRGGGNLLYAIKLRDQLELLSAEKRQVIALPVGLEGWLEESWHRFLGDKDWPLLQRGIGLLCAAREALPLAVLDELLGSVASREAMLVAMRPVLLEEPAAWRAGADVAYRLFHDSFRGFIEKKLGGAVALKPYHLELADRLASWPPLDDGFRRGYSLRHGIAQRITAANWEGIRDLCTNMNYLETKIFTTGVEATETELAEAALRCPASGRGDQRNPDSWQSNRDVIRDIWFVVRHESHWLRQGVKLGEIVYNQLRCLGWTDHGVLSAIKSIYQKEMTLKLIHPINTTKSLIRTIDHYGERPYCGVITSDGKYIVSGSNRNVIRTWDLATGIPGLSLHGHRGWVLDCSITKDGRYVISGGTDHQFILWDLIEGKGYVLIEESANVDKCIFDPNEYIAISACIKGEIRVWDYKNKKKIADLGIHPHVSTATITADGRRLISASTNGTIKVWDLDTFTERLSHEGWGCQIDTCVLVATEGVVLFGLSDGTVKLLDIETGITRHSFSASDSSITACGISNDGKSLLVGCRDGTLSLWNLPNYKKVRSLIGHSYSVNACLFTPDASNAVTVSLDGTIKIWDFISTVDNVAIIEQHAGGVSDCKILENRELISVGEDKFIRKWNIDNGMTTFAFRTEHKSGITACIYLGYDILATASYDTTIKLWNLETRQCIAALHPDAGVIRTCCLTEDRNYLVAGSDSGNLIYWKISGINVADNADKFKAHEFMISSCLPTPKADIVVCTSLLGGPIKIWNISKKEEVGSIALEGRGMGACAVSADGRLLAFAAKECTVTVWSMDEDKELLKLKGHRGDIHACAFTRDGKILLSGAWDNQLKLWDLSSGRCISTLYGVAPFSCIAIDGDNVCAGDKAGNVWLLRIVTGQLLSDIESVGSRTVANTQ